MAHNLTNQVRSIASVTKAVAAGDLSQTVDIDVHGEMLDLKRTVNSMVEQVLYILILHIYFSYFSLFFQLREFAREVTRVALEVGTHGILGGQAKVDGVEGTWMYLTNNVNVSSYSS